MPFGTGRGHLDPGLGSPFPDADPIGTELLGSVEHGALRFSGRGVASPFVFDLPARNLVSAVLEAEFEDSLIFGGAPVGTSLRVSHAYVTRGSIRTPALAKVQRESAVPPAPGNWSPTSAPTD